MRIDCSIAENYLKEGLRAYKQDGRTIGNMNSDATPEIIKKSIEAVQNWSDNHQQKTYLEDFKEKYPNAPAVPGTMPCPKHFGGVNLCDVAASIDCDECWNQFI